jgi:hypothetical protein
LVHDPLICASPVAGITGMHHHAQLRKLLLSFPPRVVLCRLVPASPFVLGSDLLGAALVLGSWAAKRHQELS